MLLLPEITSGRIPERITSGLYYFRMLLLPDKLLLDATTPGFYYFRIPRNGITSGILPDCTHYFRIARITSGLLPDYFRTPER